ncbi:hypothetical protein [Azohydromonas australica]|nr:hypothetical protein [Azohydromonas australica]
MNSKTLVRPACKGLHACFTPLRAAISAPTISFAPISTLIGTERKIHSL